MSRHVDGGMRREGSQGPGERTVVLRSVDLGETQSTQQFPTHRQIDAVCMEDNRTVILVGEGGLILRGTR